MRILPIDPLNQDWNDQPNWDLIAFCCFSTSNNLVVVGSDGEGGFALGALRHSKEAKPSAAGPVESEGGSVFGGCTGGRWVEWGVLRSGGGVFDGNTHRVTRDQESVEVNVRL